MKIKRVLSLVLVFTLVLLLPVSNSEAANKAKKKAVKLSAKKLTLTVGQKKKVKVKNAKAKKVTWSVNKKGKNIVTLSKQSKKGVTIKAAKKGKTTVTAKIKVGKKTYKKTVKVTVNNKPVTAITISSVKVLNWRTVQVSLSAAQALSVSNFTVKTKKNAKGSYTRTLKIEKVATSDKRIYKLTLDSESYISDNCYVQVTARGLKKSGTLSKETIYTEGVFHYTVDNYNYIYTNKVNDSVSKWFYGDGYGYCTYSVSGLPTGITGKVSDDGEHLEFSGKPTKAGVFRGKVVAKDEMGNTYTYNIVWLIGSANTIVAACAPIYGVVNTDGKYYVSQKVYAVGGSGSYDYATQGNAYGLEISSTYYVSGYLPATGNYSINIQVTDKNNSSIKTAAVLSASIQAGRTISGVIKDARGNALSNASVEFVNKNKSNRYTPYGYTYTDSKGAYSIRLVDGTYNAYAYGYNTEGEIVAVTVNKTRSGIDFTLPVYPITVKSNNVDADASKFSSWYDYEYNYYGSGNKLYLKAGTHKLENSYTTDMAKYTGTINATVTSRTTSVTATITSSNPVVGNITAEQPRNLTVSDSSQNCYRFTPKTTGTYYFTTSGDIECYIRLYDASGKSLPPIYRGTNMKFELSCKAGATYYIDIKPYDSNESGSMELLVSATAPNSGE
ncbi:MAG: carboxypeptidase regulatory-like domain-containing protein [Lachnospiraceae bacterium]|nr:carboxypeptidase regulatory-like domain-containing protein [Lachnospiraceae bacterium]